MHFGVQIAVTCVALFSGGALRACDTAVCLVDPDTLHFTRVITFDDLPSSPGIGRQIDTVLVQPGARFGERFLGQTLFNTGDFDLVQGPALPPLTAIAGAPGQSLGSIRLASTTVLHGHGPRGFPNPEAVGEGAISVVFDRDQTAFGFDIRGGESGAATVVFLRRDGSIIASLGLGPLAEKSYAFVRRMGENDIAGFLFENTDPQGVSLDNLRFENNQVIGQPLQRLTRHRG